MSPPTVANWSWAIGQELPGTYSYSLAGGDGGAASFSCAGSAEKPAFGIGCSNGAGAGDKVLPTPPSDAGAATCTVCQGPTNVFGAEVCQTQVSIFARAVDSSSPDGGLVGSGHSDGGIDTRDAEESGGGPTPTCVPPPAGIVAWWPGDGDARDIVGSLDGTTRNSVTPFATGLVGQGFRFDGVDDYVSLPDGPVWGFG